MLMYHAGIITESRAERNCVRRVLHYFASQSRNRRAAETDPKVRRFAEFTLDKVLGPRKAKELAELKTAHWREIKQRGKCDFCGATNVFVSNNFDTMIPNGDLPRVALICEPCARTGV